MEKLCATLGSSRQEPTHLVMLCKPVSTERAASALWELFRASAQGKETLESQARKCSGKATACVCVFVYSAANNKKETKGSPICCFYVTWKTVIISAE